MHIEKSIPSVLGGIVTLALVLSLTACGGGGGGGGYPKSTYTVTYDGNGHTAGSVPVDSTHYEQGKTVTVFGNTGSLTKTGHSFYGWSTQADGSGTIYTEAQTFLMGSAHPTLYGAWVDGFEPNNVATTPVDLGTLSSGSSRSVQMTLFPAGDADWFTASLLDVFCSTSEVQSFSSTVVLTPPTGKNYDLMVCFDFTAPETCQTAAAETTETVTLSWLGNCATSDSRDIYVRVNAADGSSAMAQNYSLSFTHLVLGSGF